MSATAYERITIGDIWPFGTHVFEADAMRAFALRYDPQPFHLDEEAARASHFGRLVASGWYTAVVMMRLMVDSNAARANAARAAGLPPLVSGPSPGIDNLAWPQPVYPGDTVTFAGKVLAKRPSQSKPGWALLRKSITGVNQHGQTVLLVTVNAFVSTR
jgi:acyl dehydratase